MLHDLQSPAPADAATEAQRHAYNAAFHQLDLNWHWDAATFAGIRRYGRAGVQSWLEAEQPHLLRAYPADFLVDAIESTRARCHASYVRQAAQGLPPSPRLAA